MDATYHYPPDLFNLVSDAIQRLNKGKADVLRYFRAAGVPVSMLADLEAQVTTNRDSIRKADIANKVLTRINEGGDAVLRARRELIRCIAQTEDFSACWENDKLLAEVLVGRIRALVNMKDTFTRINNVRESDARNHREQYEADQRRARDKVEELAIVYSDLCAQFGNHDPKPRGLALESILNRLFDINGILVKEAFKVRMPDSGSTAEQIDGVIEFNGRLFLVELKWQIEPIGRDLLAPHLVSVFSRGDVHGLFISASGFTKPAEHDADQALREHVIVLCKLQEIVTLLERGENLVPFLSKKVHAAQLDKKALFEPL